MRKIVHAFMCKSPRKKSHQIHRNINICAKFHIDLLITCKFECKFRKMHFNKVGLRLSLQPPFCSKNFHPVCCHPCLFNPCYAYFNKLRFRDHRRFAHAQGSNDRSSKALALIHIKIYSIFHREETLLLLAR